jgi:hypothetical protein
MNARSLSRWGLATAVGVLSLSILLLVTPLRGTVQSWWDRAVQPGPLSASHSFIGDACSTCHRPLAGVTPRSCVTCHAYATELLGRQPTAFHATIDQCAGCHVEHQGGQRMPLRMDHAMLEDAAQPKRALDCAACHAPKDRHQGRFGSACAACHATDEWLVSNFRHPPPRSVACVECHQAPPSHLMEHFSMVSRPAAGERDAPVDACYRCHQTTAWNDILRVGRVKHH